MARNGCPSWLDLELVDWETLEMEGTTAGVLGRVTSLQTPGLQSWLLDYDGPKLLTLTDPGSGVTTFAYDEAGKLQAVMDSAGRVTTLTVDENGDLVQMLTPELCMTELVYDNEHLLWA